MIVRALVMVVGAAACCAALIPAAGADPAASRVFDRTYVCTNTVTNGVRRIHVEARRGFRERGAWRWHASAEIENLGGPLVSQPSSGVSARNWRFGGATGLTPAQYEPTGRVVKGGVSYTTRRACVPSSKPLALAASGLDGGQAGYFVDEYECDAPRRVLLRIRAVFVSATSFTTYRESGALRTQHAIAHTRELRIAVRTESGKPFLYLEALASGSARIFTTGACRSK